MAQSQPRKSDRFYGSVRWQNLRKKILARAKYIDQLRIREGVMEDANTVHHIFPRDAYPEHEWQAWNLIAVSTKTHRLLHTPLGSLSEAGKKLLEETAEREGIPISKTILIVGLPGTGKTTLARQELKGGVAYDLDFLAGALRLRGPHEEYHAAARTIANRISKGFAEEARRHSGRVVFIRTAPTLEEVADIDPDEIIFCERRWRPGRIENEDEILDRLRELKEFASGQGRCRQFWARQQTTCRC